MISRRDLIMGGACLAGAGAAYQLKPRRNVPLLSKRTLAEIVPTAFNSWTSQDVGDPLAINGPGTLSAKIYNELLVRLYASSETGDQVLMVLAYGGRQTDELQLHRPEVCYPAFGYTLVRNEAVQMPLSKGVSLPARRLIGKRDDHEEGVVYWTRIGETLPVDAAEQRRDRFKIAFGGIIPDGLLSRFSSVRRPDSDAWAPIETFIPQLIDAVAADDRKVLIGTDRARAIVGAAA